MRKRRRITSTALLALLTGVLLVPSLASAAIEHYELNVKGLACPFCVFGVEKKLKALPGVRNVKVDLESGKARFDVAGTEPLMPQKVRDAIQDSGFTPSEDITITASGKPEQTGGELRLRFDDRDALNIVGGKEFDRVREAATKGSDSITVTGTLKRVGDREVVTVDSVRTSEGK